MTKLKAMREKSGLSQSQFSQKTEIHYRSLQNYEQGVMNFDHARFEKIINAALVLNCNIEDIIEDPDIIVKIKQYQKNIRSC